MAHNGVQLFKFIPELCVLMVTVWICNTLMFRTWVQVKTFVYHKCQHASGLPTGDLKIAAVLKTQRCKEREPQKEDLTQFQ